MDTISHFYRVLFSWLREQPGFPLGNSQRKVIKGPGWVSRVVFMVVWGILMAVSVNCVNAARTPQLLDPTPLLVSEITALPESVTSQDSGGSPQKALLPEISGQAEDQHFLDQLAEDTWLYLSSSWATTNYLPWSWRSEIISGGDYANPAEIGFLALSWIAAYEMQQPWSPTWQETSLQVQTILDQLRAWQTGSQASQPHGPNAYQNQVFYQWYWIVWSPPVVGAASGDNHLVPAVDNAWLAASLITIQQYALANGHAQLASRAADILGDMDFSLWYDPATDRFHWGGVENPQGGTLADFYSNENRIINFVARALGQLDAKTYRRSLEALEGPSGMYQQIQVEKMAWDGSFFTYAAPALFIQETSTSYGASTLGPALAAQITYAQDQGYTAWGLSDCYDLGTGGYLQQGAPPTARAGSPETRSGLVTPHASALALITSLRTPAIDNLQVLSTTFPTLYQPGYGFRDSLMADPAHAEYGKPSERYSALNQEWIFLSLANAQNRLIWDYFYRHPGVQAAHREMYPSVYLPLVRR